MNESPRTCRVAIVSPAEIIRQGLTAMLGQHSVEVTVLEPSVVLEAIAGTSQTRLDDAVGEERAQVSEIDVVLYDAVGLHEGDGVDLERVVHDLDAVVLVVSHELRPDLAARALALGADGAFSVGVNDDELLKAVLSTRTRDACGARALDVGAVIIREQRLGEDLGLTAREVEVLELMTQSLGNSEIGQQLYLSIHTVKTHLRTAYRKIGVKSRSQAVAWCIKHGFPAMPVSRATYGAALDDSRA